MSIAIPCAFIIILDAIDIMLCTYIVISWANVAIPCAFIIILDAVDKAVVNKAFKLSRSQLQCIAIQ